KSNDSRGTDHGTAVPVLFFGAALNTNPSDVAGTAHPVPGMIGTSPVLPDLDDITVADDVPMQFDYRQVYTSVLQDWLCMTEAQATAVFGRPFAKLPIFAPSSPLSSPKFENSFLTIYPNPVSGGQININFGTSLSSEITVSIYSLQGAKVFGGRFAASGSTLSFNIDSRLSSGTYILEVAADGAKHTEKLLIL
ncbi:MAG TPA: T9SS type A sorting domain-containing protein, partial [Flavobacterium sp.]|nr:T9SS type A sorting domain-containing protein [Flavobacterium sp.]